MRNTSVTKWLHHFIRLQVQPGDFCIDATMGNGNDTVLLCTLAGADGTVLAFDIQKTALESTRQHLEKADCPKNVRLLLDSHENMELYAKPETVSCITFNFGYLPGGDHKKATKPDSSIKAVKSGLRLLKIGGLMTLCIYSGGDTGLEERDSILDLIRNLDPREFLVIASEYLNRPNHPPLPVLIVRLK